MQITFEIGISKRLHWHYTQLPMSDVSSEVNSKLVMNSDSLSLHLTPACLHNYNNNIQLCACACACLCLASCPWAYATLYFMWLLSPNSHNYALIIFANCLCCHLALASTHTHTRAHTLTQPCARNCISLCVCTVIVLFAWFYYFPRCRSASCTG